MSGAAAADGRSLHISAARNVAELPRIYESIEALLASVPLREPVAHRVQLVVEELFVNFATHGDPAVGSIWEIQMTVEPGVVRCTLIDNGAPFDPWADRERGAIDGSLDERPIGGLGLHLVRQLVDRHDYCRRGDRNVTTFQIASDATADRLNRAP